MSLLEHLDQATPMVSTSKVGVITCNVSPSRLLQPIFSVSWYIPKLEFQMEQNSIRITVCQLELARARSRYDCGQARGKRDNEAALSANKNKLANRKDSEPNSRFVAQPRIMRVESIFVSARVAIAAVEKIIARNLFRESIVLYRIFHKKPLL